MAERTWLAVILCCVVWFSYIKWFAPPPVQPGAQTTQSASPQTSTSENPGMAPTGNGFFAKKPVLLDSVNMNLGNMEVVLSDAGGKISQVSLSQFPSALLPILLSYRR